MQLQQAQALAPPPWWQHALQQIQANTQEIVGQAFLKVNAEVCELREEVRDLRQQAQLASAAASEAKEQVRAMKADVSSVPSPGSHARKGQSGTRQQYEEKEDDSSNDDREERREREMVIAGIMRNTPADEVISCVLDVTLGASKCEAESYTTRKLTSFGIIRFKTLKEKGRFKRWLADLKEPLMYKGRKLHIGDNETRAVRTMGRAVSKIKRALMENKPLRTDVIVERRTGEVFIGRKRVAKWEDGTLKLKGEALELRERIQALIEERQGGGSDSE